ncbi:MAG: glycosyltransferase [Paracoccus sp. (in: a-proteobacteria)]
MLKQNAPPPPARKVLIVARDLARDAGGMEKTAANLANHLARSGRECAVICQESVNSMLLYPLDEAVRRLSGSCDGSWMVETAQQYAPDAIVYFYSTSVEATHVLALWETGIPVILHEGSNPERVINNNWAAAKAITPAQAGLERLAMMAGCARIRFTLPQYQSSLPPGLRADSVAFPNAFTPADPANLGLRSETGRKIFLNIGGLKKVKNVMAAMQAFARIADDLPDWDFHIFSAEPRGNQVRPKLESFIVKEGLQSRVRLFAPTPQIGREYGRSHVHVIASKDEGLPNCVAEAARHGLPSIGFACCVGTNAMIEDDHNGLLVECGKDEIAGLAEAMMRAATDDAARHRWGATALRESDIYDPDRIFAQWDSLIAAAAADRSPPQDRLRRRFGETEWRRLRAVQRASLGAAPWPAPPARPFDEARPTVSVIVPLFNKESFIAETLDSIAACPYPAKEVIVVDDCSTDGSTGIAREICARHGWRVITHEQNGGLSVSRNTGLDAALGEYVHFWDADDVYAPDGIGRLLCIMHEDAADIGCGIATREGEVLPHYASSVRDVTGVNYARHPESLTTASACFKVYRRAFLHDHGLRFEPGLYMQDSAFNLCAFPLAERIVMSSAVLGDYRLVEQSGARQFHAGRFSSVLQIEELTRAFYAENGLHGVDRHRQRHIVRKVLPQFIMRAQMGYKQIDDQTRPWQLDFDFLTALRAQLQYLPHGLMIKNAPMRLNRIQLACYALREGYLIWVPALLGGRVPVKLRPGLLARSAAERAHVAGLIGDLQAG